jgi:hypothetical protein
MKRPTGDRDPSGVTVTFPVHLRNGNRGRRRMRKGGRPEPPEVEEGRVPKLARSLALALHLNELLREGSVHDHADLARLARVSVTRMSQLMALIDLDPRIQEQILFMPRTLAGRDPVSERAVRPITAQPDWEIQRKMWVQLGLPCQGDSSSWCK